MNGSGEERYSKNWERLSKLLRLLFPCAICKDDDYSKKECHHIDSNKKNSSIKNAAVLCAKCHTKLHRGEAKIPESFVTYTIQTASKISSNR